MRAVELRRGCEDPVQQEPILRLVHHMQEVRSEQTFAPRCD